MNRSKSILYVDDSGRVLLDEDTDDVEAQRIEEAWSPIEEVLSSQGADGGLFAGGDGFEWMPEAGSPAQFHFDEDEGVFAPEDQVQFPVAGAVVALDEDVPSLLQVTQRELFAPRAGGTFAQGPTPA